MRLGISTVLHHDSAGAWAAKLRGLGCGAAVFPCEYSAKDSQIDAYVQACRDHDLIIAEVHVWNNPMHNDPVKRMENIKYCQEQLRLADYIGAQCCVNITGSCGPIWDGGYAENYADDIRLRIIDTTREIIDAVTPSKTFYTLEPMPWMLPDSPESYLDLLKEVDRPGFGVHMDVVNMISCPERYFFNGRFAEKCFALLGAHVKSCHVKDVRLERFLTFNLKETACGQGGLDIVRYAQLADASSPDMPFLIEHLTTEEEFLHSLDYVKKLLAGIPMH